ncbi:hypothetical protein CLAIMM_00903 isoform 1 [Cladophialophora immunda]|nr:hypothetical protein CLAIMM_00903 isoform 1 [Cladophialophora immunda]
MGRPNELPVHLGQGPWNDNLGTGLRTCCCGGNVGVELSQPLEQWQSRQTKSIAVLCCRYKYCFRGNLDRHLGTSGRDTAEPSRKLSRAGLEKGCDQAAIKIRILKYLINDEMVPTCVRRNSHLAEQSSQRPERSTPLICSWPSFFSQCPQPMET